MFGLGWQEFGVFLSAGFYIFLLGGVLYLGYHAARGGLRREQDDRKRDEATLVARLKQEVLADLDVARRAKAAASASSRGTWLSKETDREERGTPHT